MTDPLDLLATADPERDLPVPPPDEALLARLIATTPARSPISAGNRRRRVAALTVAACTVAAGAMLVGLGASSDGPSIASRAYARTAPNADDILHTLEVTTGLLVLKHPASGVPARQPLDERIETWTDRDEVHRVITLAGSKGPQTYEQVLGADGVLHAQRLPDGDVQIIRASDSRSAAAIVGDERVDAIARFRKRFAAQRLRDLGELPFSGRRARAYGFEQHLSNSQVGPQSHTETYYIDAQTGVPLGLRSVTDNRTLHDEWTTVLRTFERLPATPENLKLVTARDHRAG